MAAADGFEEFVAIVEQGSLTAAAAHLGLARPTLGRRLDRLEERLGVRLLHRTTRRLTLTRHGERLYARALGVVHAAREAEAEIRRLDGVPRGLLRISIPDEMPQSLFVGWVADFLRAWPEVQLQVLPSGTGVDLVGERLDVALRLGVVDDPNVIVKTLLWQHRIAVASPRYLEARGVPEEAGDLAGHDGIVGFRPGGLPVRRWPLLGGSTVDVAGRVAFHQEGMRVQAALQHLGIALVVGYSAADALQRGELVQVLPDVLGQRDQLCLLYADRQFVDPKVRVFMDFVAERIAAVRAARR